jgi:hypothetical protein
MPEEKKSTLYVATGILKEKLEPQTGEGKNGAWRKETIVIEKEDGEYKKTMAFTLFNSKFDVNTISVGDEIEVSFDISSNVHNGKAYTDAKAIFVKSLSSNSEKPKSQTPNTKEDEAFIDGGDDLGLPF